jgi:hypothetical protein
MGNVVTTPLSQPKHEQPHFRYYKHLTDLSVGFDFHSLRPSQQTCSPPMLSNGTDTYLFYLPDYRRGINGRLPAVLGRTMRIRRFDPLTGRYAGDTTHRFAEDTWL